MMSASAHARAQWPLVPLASTQVPFFEYIDACPQRLKDLGLFEFVRFDKWPHTAELQPTATAVALVRTARSKWPSW